MASPPQQQVVVVQQAQPQQQVVYVNQYGQPIQPQQVVVQQTVPQTTANATQQAVELQVGTNTQIPSDAPPPDYGSPAHDNEYATHSNQYENPQQNEQEHAYIYDKPPTDEKHEWLNDDDVPPPGYDDIAPREGLGCWGGCKETPHITAWACTILVIFPIFMYLICLISLTAECYCEDWATGETQSDEASIAACDSDDLHCEFVCASTYRLGAAFWGIFAGIYVLYMIEATCCSSSFKYLKNYTKGETVYAWVGKIKEQAPRIWWRVECYHFETRVEHYHDSDGNSRTRTRREKVTTHRASQDYAYSSWADISKDVTGLDEYALTKFNAYKQFSFADTETENDYNQKSAEFRRMNDRDVYQSFSYGVELDGFKSKILFETKADTKSSFVSLNAYICASIVLLTAPYRMYFAAVCGTKTFLFDKQVKAMAPIQQQQVIIVQAQPQVVVIQQPQNVAQPQ